jgi:tRNA(fMet)-specific endonuclease VapC
MIHLLDTNTASYVIKGTIPRVRERLLRVPMSDIAISAITEAELRFGVERRPDVVRLRTAVAEFLLLVEIQPWTSESAKHYAIVRTALERAGQPMGNLDMLIAAHALATESVLVTHDRAFQSVKHLKTPRLDTSLNLEA